MSKKYYDRALKGTGVKSTPFHSSFGASILKKFGWSEGGGLGKNEDGRINAIQIKRRDDNLGLGAPVKSEADQWTNWWDQLYNSTASQFKNANQTSSSSSESSDESPDENVRISHLSSLERSNKRRKVTAVNENYNNDKNNSNKASSFVSSQHSGEEYDHCGGSGEQKIEKKDIHAKRKREKIGKGCKKGGGREPVSVMYSSRDTSYQTEGKKNFRKENDVREEERVDNAGDGKKSEEKRKQKREKNDENSVRCNNNNALSSSTNNVSNSYNARSPPPEMGGTAFPATPSSSGDPPHSSALSRPPDLLGICEGRTCRNADRQKGKLERIRRSEEQFKAKNAIGIST